MLRRNLGIQVVSVRRGRKRLGITSNRGGGGCYWTFTFRCLIVTF